MATRVVIIGGGYTGVWGFKLAKQHLGRLIKQGEAKITIISPKTYHSFHGWTAEALTGIISIANRQSPLRRIFAGHDFRVATAESVDLARKVVKIRYLSDGREEEVPYDHLLLANGSYDNMESIDGLAQYGWSVKAQGGVSATRNQLLRLMDTADSLQAGVERDAWMTVVVAGGGFAGVEISSNIAEMFEASKRYYPVLQQKKVRIVLVHSGDKLLPVMRPTYDRFADYCTKQIENYGIEIHYNTKVQSVSAEGATLSNGTFIPSKTVICTLGQRAAVFPGTESLPRNAKGLLITDEYLRVKGAENVWSGGDAAEVPFIKGGSCPSNALWAIKHGVWVGQNIAHTIRGKSLYKFTYRGLGQAASMGVGKGASELYGRQFTGWMGWILRFFFFLYFQPSPRQAVRVFGDWLTLGILGRYMSQSSEWQRGKSKA